MYHEGMAPEFVVTVDREQRWRLLHRRRGGPGSRRDPRRRLRQAGREAFEVRRLLAKGRAEPSDHRHRPWRRMDGERRKHHARAGPELTKGGRFVAFRWTIAGAAKPTATPEHHDGEIIEDVFGGIAHIMEHARVRRRPDQDRRDRRQRGRTPAAAAALMPGMIGVAVSARRQASSNSCPATCPRARRWRRCARSWSAAIKAVAPSYGVFRAARLKLYTDDPSPDESWKQSRRSAPAHSRPSRNGRCRCSSCVARSRSFIVHHDDAQEFLDALGGRGANAPSTPRSEEPNMRFDWKPDEKTKATRLAMASTTEPP